MLTIALRNATLPRMPKKQKLKVFRTPIGFHDAYVAAPSRKAALKAWGSDADLFARGIAELVTDEGLAREPLKHPGEVIRLSRGSIREQLAALPGDEPATKPGPESTSKSKSKSKPKAAERPRPSRKAVDRAERALASLLESQAADESALAERERRLAEERRELDRKQARDRQKAERALDQARADHSDAMNRWIEGR